MKDIVIVYSSVTNNTRNIYIHTYSMHIWYNIYWFITSIRIICNSAIWRSNGVV